MSRSSSSSKAPTSLDLLSRAAFEKVFEAPTQSALASLAIQGVGLRVFIESPSTLWGANFSVFAIGLKRSARSGSAQNAEALTQGFAARARAELYGAGFSAPELSFNDFPAASYLLSDDISCSQIALQPGAAMERARAEALACEIIQGSAASCFALYAISLPTGIEGDFDHRANEAILDLRSQARLTP